MESSESQRRFKASRVAQRSKEGSFPQRRILTLMNIKSYKGKFRVSKKIQDEPQLPTPQDDASLPKQFYQ
jgi:hypothetical protein